MISLRCEACSGVMDVDENREILTCPYCNSKQLIPISDSVKIEQIRQNAKTERQKIKIEAEMLEEKERKKSSYITFFALIGVAIAMILIGIFMGG